MFILPGSLLDCALHALVYLLPIAVLVACLCFVGVPRHGWWRTGLAIFLGFNVGLIPVLAFFVGKLASATSVGVPSGRELQEWLSLAALTGLLGIGGGYLCLDLLGSPDMGRLRPEAVD